MMRLRLVVLLSVSLLLSCCLRAAEPAWGTWLTDSAEAKRIAATYNRPLVAVVGSRTCGHCIFFEKNIKNDADLLNFAREKRLVLLYKNDSTFDQMTQHLKLIPNYTTILPYVFIFKVKDGANLTDNSKKALNPDQVEMVRSLTFDRLAGVNYPGAGGKINNVTISEQEKWNGKEFTALLSSFFPNQFWTEDMDSSLDEPTLPNEEEQPAEEEQNVWGTWLDNVAQAKKIAYQHGRPLIAVVSGNNCGHCILFDERIIPSVELMNFARTNRIVLVHKQNNFLASEVNKDIMRKHSEYAPQSTSILPFVLLLKVREGADLIHDNTVALNSDQVEVLKSTTFNTVARINYPAAGATINNVKISGQLQWTGEEFVELMKSFFPNDQGIPLIVYPDGYESALDCGEIADQLAPPANDSGWIRATPLTMPAAGGEHWFKFTGRPNQRYGLYTEHGNEQAIPATMPAMSFELTAFAEDPESHKPVYPEVKTWRFKDFEAMNRGFQFVTPEAEKESDTEPRAYYLRLTAKADETNTADLSYKLKIRHYAERKTTSGTSARPLWKDAQPGKWSMNVEDARKKATIDGKGVLLNFTGHAWCPYCIGAEHRFVETDEFKAATKDMYLLMLDNRRRSGHGPSLLTEDFSGGYLKAFGLTAEQGAATLAENKELQQQFVLPNQRQAHSTYPALWPQGTVGYPTFVYCRVNGETLEPVGRFSSSPADGAEAAALLNQLQAMNTAGLREADAYATTTTRALPADVLGGTEDVLLTPLASKTWFSFTATDSMPLLLTVPAVASKTTHITLGVYDEQGESKLRSLGKPLSEGLLLPFVPEPNVTYKICLEAVNLQDTLQLQFNYERKTLKATLSLETDELFVSRCTTSVTIPVQLTSYADALQPFTYTYSVKAAGTNGLATQYFTAVSKAQKTWDNTLQQTQELTVNLNIPQTTAPWTGTKDLELTLDAVSGDGNYTSEPTRTLIRVCGTSQFAPKPAQTDWTLYQGLHTVIDLPVCLVDNASYQLTGTLPEGLTVENHLDDATNPRLTLTGIPAKTSGKTSFTLQLKDAKGKVTDTLAFSLQVNALAPYPPALTSGAFAATLEQNGETDGLFSLVRGADQQLSLTLCMRFQEQPLTASVPSWSFDPERQAFVLQTACGEAHVSVTVPATGTGKVSVLLPDGTVLNGDLQPQVRAPKDFQGDYTVAIRQAGSSGYALGWMTIAVNEQGLARAQLCLNDGTQATSIDLPLTPLGSNDGRLAYFLPLYWQGNRYQGHVQGQLQVSRNREDGRPSLSGCDASTWQKTSGKPVTLSLCGVEYHHDQSLSAITENSTFILVAEQPDNALAPTGLSIEGETLTARNNLPFGPQAGALTVAKDGTFTSTWTLLTSAGEAVEVPVSGILTPVKEDCCSTTPLTAVAYGSYLFDGKRYGLCLSPKTSQPLTLTAACTGVNEEQKTMTVSLQADNAAGFVLRRESDQSLKVVRGKSAQTEVDATSPWSIIAVPLNKNPEAEKFDHASDSVWLHNRFGAETFTLGTTVAGDTSGAAQLHVGWNLIGIPADVAVPTHQTLADQNGNPIACFDHQTVPATQLESGRGYWVYLLPDVRLNLTATRLNAPIATEPERGWHCRAWVRDSTGWFWNGSRFVQAIKNKHEFTGFWQFVEPTTDQTNP